MQVYPRNRCPACKEFFRLEIKATDAPSLFVEGLIVCPRCGLKFERFPFSPQQAPIKQPGAS